MPITQYEIYKDSGIQWLGKIPEHWQVKRIKDVINKIGSGVTPKGGSEVYVESGIPFLRSQNVHDEGLRIEEVSFITEEINESMKNSQIRPNDIVLNITGASIGRTCIIPETLPKANISQHILYLRFKKDKVSFISKYLKSNFIKEYTLSIQAGASKEALTMGQALNFPLLIPNFDEQTTIAQYLDQKTVAIDKKIALLEQKITTYQDLRKSLINETVCRGLNKSVPLKDSGIEWIGQIPAHWEVKRMEDIALISTGNKNSEQFDDNGIYPFFVRSANILRINSFSFDEEAILTPGDGDIGKIFHYITGKFDVHQRVYCIRKFTKRIKGKYLYYLLFCKLFDEARVNNSNATVNSLRLPFFQNFSILMPPFFEQTTIANYLDEKTQKIDAIIKNLNEQIKTLKEFRKTLINDVVTGKIRVATEEVTVTTATY